MSEEISVKHGKELIKELRIKTGAGITDCKKALEASNYNIDIAIENLRKKGLASSDKKAGRIAAEGLIESYIHAGSRIGVLVELNCETDFVARQPAFKDLAKNIAMQLAACQNIEYVSSQHIPQHIIKHEEEIEANKEDLLNKPKEIKEKILAGRLEKRLKELSLMDQPFIKDSNILIQELVNKNISLLGENIQIRRFQRFILGQGLKKKNEDFADEVAKIINMQ
uniref:Elongation factor Ts, mitochondrial n=1 Tax=Antithamnion hubbsii TaxID=1005974 RepID=A0A4D6WMG8_9FLOR|nr:Translation elongation factor Ts [Antithamnion hubbsii]